MTETIESLLAEARTFPPPASFRKDALVTGAEIYDEADQDWEGFWARQAADLLDWFEEWHTILEWDLRFARWFVGGKLNATHTCLDVGDITTLADPAVVEGIKARYLASQGAGGDEE
jgi:acetyl-CoA synthetase